MKEQLIKSAFRGTGRLVALALMVASLEGCWWHRHSIEPAERHEAREREHHEGHDRHEEHERHEEREERR